MTGNAPARDAACRASPARRRSRSATRPAASTSSSTAAVGRGRAVRAAASRSSSCRAAEMALLMSVIDPGAASVRRRPPAAAPFVVLPLSSAIASSVRSAFGRATGPTGPASSSWSIARRSRSRTRGSYRTLQMEIDERRGVEAMLQTSNRRKDEFLAMLSHELRNPLAPIRTALEVIRRLAPAEPKLTWATDVTGRQVAHLTRLVEDLLDVARINQGKIALQTRAARPARRRRARDRDRQAVSRQPSPPAADHGPRRAGRRCAAISRACPRSSPTSSTTPPSTPTRAGRSSWR